MGWIGDTPFGFGVGQDNQDNYPIMQPNGWLTMFYLTLHTNLPASTKFQINETTFGVGQSGSATLTLGYFAKYIISLPQAVKLSNGTTLSFVKWQDGVTSHTRTVSLSSNSTFEAIYALAPTTNTTTTITTSTISVHTTSSSSTSTTTSSASAATSTLKSSSSTTIDLAIGGVAAVVLVMVGVLLVVRRRSS